MTSNKEQLIEEIQQETPSLENIEFLGKSLLSQELAVIEQLSQMVTYGGFRKALKLALTHEVMPEAQKTELIPKQQLVAAHIAKAMDLILNLRMAQMGQKLQNEEETPQKESASEQQ